MRLEAFFGDHLLCLSVRRGVDAGVAMASLTTVRPETHIHVLYTETDNGVQAYLHNELTLETIAIDGGRDIGLHIRILA